MPIAHNGLSTRIRAESPERRRRLLTTARAASVVTAVGDLPLPDPLCEHYRRQGIESLYPPQQAAVDAGLMDGVSIVASVPTASGKTLLAELAMVTSPGMALYVVPLRALAREKGETFASLPGVEVAVATGELAADSADIAGADVVVATSEKVDSLLRAGASWLSKLGCVVLDEIHLVDQADRGPTLEMVVAKLRRLTANLQVVALSATIANPDALATWLDAEMVVSDWRPVALHRGVYANGSVRFDSGDSVEVARGEVAEPAVALVHGTVEDGGQALVFVHSRRAAEDLAETIASGDDIGTATVASAVRESARTGTGRALADALAGGAAFHHAGLRPEHRSTVEAAFRGGDLAVVCATPTLAAGVNMPARRVIVRDTRRYTDDGWVDLPVLEVHQMFGRAGRPGLDPHGEAILVAEDEGEAGELRSRYLEGEPEPVTSSLATQDALRTHVLATIASGVATTRADLVDVLEGTFYAVEEDPAVLVDVADLVLDDLEATAMLDRVDDGLRATSLGETVSRQYVDPRTGAAFVDALDALDTRGGASRLAILQVVCEAQAVPSPRHRGDAQGEAHQFAVQHEDELLVDLSAFDGEYASWLETLDAVRILRETLDGADEAALTEAYGIGPGDLRAIVDRASWIAGAFAAVARVEESSHAPAIEAVAEALAALGTEPPERPTEAKPGPPEGDP